MGLGMGLGLGLGLGLGKGLGMGLDMGLGKGLDEELGKSLPALEKQRAEGKGQRAKSFHVLSEGRCVEGHPDVDC